MINTSRELLENGKTNNQKFLALKLIAALSFGKQFSQKSVTINNLILSISTIEKIISAFGLDDQDCLRYRAHNFMQSDNKRLRRNATRH